MPRSVETTCYFVVAEALANVTKHVQAERLVEIRVWLADGASSTSTSTMTDSGGADPATGSGLRGLADRVAAVGGTARRCRWRQDGGTRLQAEMPCA